MFLILLLAISTNSVHAKSLKGIASTLDGQKTIYTEVHKIELDEKGLNKRIETKYLKPNSQVFAEMTSDFSKNPTVPEIHFLDKRFNRIEKLELEGKGPAVIFKSSQNNQPQSTKKFTLKNNMAAGQGFDNFVKINFEKLSRSNVPLNFGVLSEMNFFSFNGYKKKDVSKNVIQFGIDLSSFLLRLFTHELILEYNQETKQILSYRGLSNILTDEGKSQSVWIRYELVTEAAQ